MNSPTKPRHILVVEDTTEDYELINHELAKDGSGFSTKRIDSTEELARELEQQPPDVVLCDHGSASWDSFAILRQVRARSADVPFILVTGAMRETDISRALDSGANDLVFKHHLAGLAPAIRRSLHLFEQIQLRRAAERERDQLRQELETLRDRQHRASFVRICAECKRIPEAGQGWVKLEDYFEQHLAIRFSHGLCPGCVRKYYADLR